MDLSIEILASLIASAIIYGIVRFIKALRTTPQEPSIQQMVNEMIEEDNFTLPKLKIKPVASLNSPRRIKISGTGSTITIAPGGPTVTTPVSISGTGATQTIYVSEYNQLLISMSGTGGLLKIDNSLKKNIIDLKISGTGANVKWGNYHD